MLKNFMLGSLLIDYWFFVALLVPVGLMSLVWFIKSKRLVAELEVAALAFGAQQGMLIINAKGVIIRINKAFAEMTGFSRQDIEQQSIYVVGSEKHDANFYHALWKTLLETGRWQGEFWVRYHDNSDNLQWLTLTVVRANSNAVACYVGTLTELIERKVIEDEIYHLAFFDSLTDLANRRLLLERLKHDIEVVRREGKQLALMMLDLDRFKSVNDYYGHAAGDELLVLVAERLTGRLRDVDLVARLGGDEFVVLLVSIAQPEDAARVAGEIVADIGRPFKLAASESVSIGVSIGISLFPQYADNHELLLEQADQALYKAKAEGKAKGDGRGCFAYFSKQFTLVAHERIELEHRLRRAIERQELSVVYQPQVDISSGQIVGAQMFLRWRDPKEGLISPSRFIHVAEVSGLIALIGEWMLRKGCVQAKHWMDQGLPKLRLSVKLSPYQIRHGDINAVVSGILESTGFPAELLELELLENSLSEHDGSADVLRRIREQGVKLVIDDFGASNSSLAYLQRFPLDVLKIGRMLIEERESMKFVATIVAIAKTLGMKTLAEGVETYEQLSFLKAEGCDTYQGYFKSHPVSAEEFVALLKS